MRQFIGKHWQTAIVFLIPFACLGLGYWWGSELAEKPEDWYARVVNEAVANAPSSCPDCGAAMSYQGPYLREFGCGAVWRAADAGDNGDSVFLRIGVFTPALNCHSSEPEAAVGWRFGGWNAESGDVLIEAATTQPGASQILIGDGLPPSATWTITDPSPDSYWQAPAPRDLGGPVWDDEWDRNHDQVGARPGYVTTQPEARR